MLPVVGGLFEYEMVSFRGLDVPDQILCVEYAEDEACVYGEGFAAAEVEIASFYKFGELGDEGFVDGWGFGGREGVFIQHLSEGEEELALVADRGVNVTGFRAYSVFEVDDFGL